MSVRWFLALASRTWVVRTSNLVALPALNFLLRDPQGLLERADFLASHVGRTAQQDHAVERLDGLVAELVAGVLEGVLSRDLAGTRHLDDLVRAAEVGQQLAGGHGQGVGIVDVFVDGPGREAGKGEGNVGPQRIIQVGALAAHLRKAARIRLKGAGPRRIDRGPGGVERGVMGEDRVDRLAQGERGVLGPSRGGVPGQGGAGQRPQ